MQDFIIHYLIIGLAITVSTMFIKNLREYLRDSWWRWGFIGFFARLIFLIVLYPVAFYRLAKDASEEK